MRREGIPWHSAIAAMITYRHVVIIVVTATTASAIALAVYFKLQRQAADSRRLAFARSAYSMAMVPGQTNIDARHTKDAILSSNGTIHIWAASRDDIIVGFWDRYGKPGPRLSIYSSAGLASRFCIRQAGDTFFDLPGFSPLRVVSGTPNGLLMVEDNTH
jgi:hypothetical protein